MSKVAKEKKTAGQLASVVLNGTEVQITPDGKVSVISDELTRNDIQRMPAIAELAAETAVTLGDQGFTANGVKVEFSKGRFVIHTKSKVQIKPATTFEIGTEMEDGSVFAGLTPDGNYKIFARKQDLSVRGSFNKLQEAIKELNAKEKANWQIGSAEVVQIVRQNLAEGPLKGTFKKFVVTDPYQPQRIFSRAHVGVTSTEDTLNSSYVQTVRFTQGNPYSREQVMSRKMHNLKERFKRALDIRPFGEFKPDGYSNKSSYAPGKMRSEAKDKGTFACRPVQLEPFPSV